MRGAVARVLPRDVVDRVYDLLGEGVHAPHPSPEWEATGAPYGAPVPHRAAAQSPPHSRVRYPRCPSIVIKVTKPTPRGSSGSARPPPLSGTRPASAAPRLSATPRGSDHGLVEAFAHRRLGHLDVRVARRAADQGVGHEEEAPDHRRHVQVLLGVAHGHALLAGVSARAHVGRATAAFDATAGIRW